MTHFGNKASIYGSPTYIEPQLADNFYEMKSLDGLILDKLQAYTKIWSVRKNDWAYYIIFLYHLLNITSSQAPIQILETYKCV